MKVYIVTDGEYSDYHIEAVFLDKRKAYEYAAVKKLHRFVEYKAKEVGVL